MDQDQGRALTDVELKGLFDGDGDLSLLTSEEQQRLLKLTEAEAQPRTPVAGRGTAGDFSQSGRKIASALPAVGGTIGGMVGAVGGPVVAAGTAGLGGMTGRLAQRALNAEGIDAPDVATEGLKQAGAQAVGGVVGKGIEKAGTFVASRAVPMVRSALKPVWATVRKRANVEGVMPSAVANSQARFIVDRQLRTPEQADAIVKTLGRQIDNSNAAVQTPLDTAERVPRYLDALMRRAGGQIFPRADRGAVQAKAAEVLADSPLSQDVVTQVPRQVASPIVDASGNTITRTVMQPVTSRAMRTDVTANEGMRMARDTSKMSTGKSWGTDPGAVGSKAAEQMTERAVRDSVKAANPAVRPMLRDQGRAMDARSLLDRATWRDANRDQVNLGGLMGVANGRPTIGAILQLIKEQQLNAGLAAGKWGPRMARAGQAEMTPAALAAALRALSMQGLLESHGQAPE